MLAVVEQLADHGANREAHRSRISRLDLDHHFRIALTATEGRGENKREIRAHLPIQFALNRLEAP
ncbi:hypothetical protein [Mesorhizobium sp. M1121]|uniref:hypothetical protein n=1 Tax=Mesorhizobium sp. M1121 TaxID=2957058 RepID=UPI003338D2D0